jgi:Tfp pilus assembly protein PilO
VAAINTEKLSNNNLAIILLLISLLVLGAAGLATKALAKTIKRDTTVLQKKLAAEDQLTKNLTAAPTLVTAYGELGPRKALLADALPDKADFPSLMVTLENIALMSGAKLKVIAPIEGTVVAADASASDASTPTPQAYQFSISLSGNYDALLKYIGGLETSARPMRILSSSFTGSGSLLNVELAIETYYQDKAKLPFGTEIVK